MATILVLTEEPLLTGDVAQLQRLHPGAVFHVLVPKDPSRSVVASFIDHLSLGELREAWDALIQEEDPQDSIQDDARETLHLSLQRLQRAGIEHDGYVLPGDPVQALPQAVHNLRADELVVITRPHAVEDTFHTDWASRARQELGLPVLHLYAGMNRLG